MPKRYNNTIYKLSLEIKKIIKVILSSTTRIGPSPRSPTVRVYVAVGRNIIRNQFLTMAKCRGDGREPPQRVQRAGVAVLWY